MGVQFARLYSVTAALDDVPDPLDLVLTKLKLLEVQRDPCAHRGFQHVTHASKMARERTIEPQNVINERTICCTQEKAASARWLNSSPNATHPIGATRDLY